MWVPESVLQLKIMRNKDNGEPILPFMLLAGIKTSRQVGTLSTYLFNSKGLH